MARIEIANLYKEYGSLQILRGLDLAVGEGEFVTLIGPSGCGKSTLLKLIAGLDTISAGEIRIGDRIVNDLPPQQRDLAMVFQNYALYPTKTVRENLAFGMRIKGFARTEIERRIKDVTDTLGLSELLDRRPRQLSGGQRQRVAMGRAMVREPLAFLLDEPLSNLDAALRTNMRSEIKMLHQRLGRTMVYVTHDQIEAMTMADRIAIMQNGQIVQYGAPDDLYFRPCNQFVASFFGTPQINLWSAKIVGEEGGRISVRIGSDAVFSVPKPAALRSKDVILGIRPETLRIRRTAERSAEDISVHIDLLEPTGAQTQIRIALGDSNDPVFANVLVPGRLGVGEEHVKSLTSVVDDVHLFEPVSGVRLV